MKMDTRILKEKLENHIESNSKDFASFSKSLTSIKKDITVMKENHLAHLEKDVATLKTNVSWITKIQWFMLTTGVTNLIGVIYLIVK